MSENDESGYVVLQYHNEDQKKLLQKLISDDGVKLVKKMNELQEEESGNNDEGLFESWGADNYSGKSKESVYEFV